MADSSHPHVGFLARSSLHRLMLVVLATLLSAEFVSIWAQVDSGGQKKVLVLHLMRNEPSTLVSETTYQKILTDGLEGRLDYYSEYVDLARFGGNDYQGALRDFLEQKYKGTNFDLIIARSADVTRFLGRYAPDLFPNVPVVFARTDVTIDSATPPNFTGIVYDTDLRGTLDIIRRLQPGARRVFVITGSSEAVDKWHEARARNQFKDYGNQLEFTYWSGLPIDELKRRVSRLTPDSVIYFVVMVQDPTGERFGMTDALDQIAAASNVPIYTWWDAYLGHGVVGGKLASSERVASRTAELGLRILRGERLQQIPITKVDTSRLAFDWRELERWKLNENKLPAGSEVLFVEATFWQRYRKSIIGVVALLALQSALIAALLVERRRRRKATIGLTESEKRYRNVVETQTELICRFLPDTTLTFVNEAYCKYFGKPAHELLGTKFLLLIPEPEREPTQRYLDSLAKKPRSETREHPVIRPDGNPGWQQWTNSVISADASGRVELQGVGRDISERKRLEQELSRSQRHFSTLVENSPDVICRLNRDLQCIYASPNLDGTFGIPPESFLGKRPSEVAVSDYDWSEFESRCRQALDKSQSTVHESQYRGRYYRTRIVPEYSSDGAVESVMTISEDFTERRRAELEMAKLTTRLFTLQEEERRRIARELHDGAAQNVFAVTLNLGRLETALADSSPEISRVLRDSQQLAEQCVTELRTLSYLLHPPALDQSGLADALHWFARGFSKRSGIQVDTAAIQDVGRMSFEIETALFRIVQESLTNVHRHSGSNTASISLEERNGDVRLQVQDRGHGIPREGNGSIDENAELGVGIPGMRQRLVQLGGRLEIESSDTGTTIIAVVPTSRGSVFSHLPVG